MRVVVVSTTLALGGCVADGSDSDEDDGIASSNAPAAAGEDVSGGQAGAGFYEVPSLASLLAAEQAMQEDTEIGRGRRKATGLAPSNYSPSSDTTIAETNMGNWIHDTTQVCNGNVCSIQHHCNFNEAFCPEGTIAGSIALKSLSDQGGGDDLAVTGVGLGCNNPTTGQFVQWAIPQNQASGAWDTSSACNLGTRIRGGNFVLLAGPSSFDDTGVSDGAISCTNGTTLDVAVNSPSWGSWQGWRNCPSGKVVCGIQQKFDPDNSSDDSSVAGIRFKCCNN
jgi:hypothetical protein